MSRQNDSLIDLKESGEATQLTAANQPPAELKKIGWQKKRLLREVLQCKVPDEPQIEKLAKFFGLKASAMTIELALNLAQAKKAMSGDTNAYRAIMERAFGYPVTPIATNNNSNIKIEIVYGNNPVGISDKE